VASFVHTESHGQSFAEALTYFPSPEAFDGPSIIIAYSHCIAHGYDMAHGLDQQRLAVDAAVWPLFRFDPRRVAQGLPPLTLDSGDPKISARQYMRNETRFRMVEKIDPARFKRLALMAEKNTRQNVAVYKQMAGITVPQVSDAEAEAEPATAKK